MSEYKCKCGNTSDFFIERNPYQCGMYCGKCGKWVKWLNKNEERLFKHKQNNTIQKPLNCRNALCGATCSIMEAEMWSDNPNKCPRFEYNPYIYDKAHDADVINKFAETLKSRLGDAIYPQDFESMKNLIDDVVKEQK